MSGGDFRGMSELEVEIWNECARYTSDQPTRQQEKQMGKFKSPKQAQRFLSVHGQVRNLFGAHRYKMAANDQRAHLIARWNQWQEIVMQ